MKLEMSVPERPGWIFVIPGFDFVVLLLALVMLSGVVAKESYVEIKLPPSEFRGVRLGDEKPVIVMLKKTSKGSAYYLNGTRVMAEDLEEVIRKEADERGTRRVAIEIDRDASMKERAILVNILTKLNLRILEGYRRVEPKNEEL
jgi:biopolymer transport protein ExbD